MSASRASTSSSSSSKACFSRRPRLMTAVCGSLAIVLSARTLGQIRFDIDQRDHETFLSSHQRLCGTPDAQAQLRAVSPSRRISRHARGGEESPNLSGEDAAAISAALVEEPPKKSAPELITELFNTMDFNKNGFITKAESIALSVAFGEDAEEAAITWTEFLEEVDHNEDGKVANEEYVKYWMDLTTSKGKIAEDGDFIPAFKEFIYDRIAAIKTKVAEIAPKDLPPLDEVEETAAALTAEDLALLAFDEEPLEPVKQKSTYWAFLDEKVFRERTWMILPIVGDGVAHDEPIVVHAPAPPAPAPPPVA